MDIDTYAEQVSNRQELCEFLGVLLSDLEQNREEWENDTLETFIDGLRGWVGSMDGYFENIGEEVPTTPNWSLVAQMLVAATVYE